MHQIAFGVIGLVQTLDYDLTLRQLAALALLNSRESPMTVRDVASTLGIHKPATSRALVALERRGWIVRTKGETDKRDVLVATTESGRSAMQAIVEAMEIIRPSTRPPTIS